MVDPNFSNTNHTRSLQQRVVRFATFGIILTALIVSLSTTIPLYYHRLNESEKNLKFAVSTQSMTVREMFMRFQDIATQISTRTNARKQLEAFNRGEINATELLKQTTPILLDAKRISSDIAGITRVSTKNKALVKVGTDIPHLFWQSLVWGQQYSVQNHVAMINGTLYFLVYAAILSRSGDYEGFDVVAFRINRLHVLEDEFEASNKKNQMLAGWRENNVNIFYPEINTQSPETLHKNLLHALKLALAGKEGLLIDSNVIAYAPVKDFHLATLIITNKTVLYQKVKNQMLILVFTLACIILLGVWGVNRLIQPLAGRILIHSDELEQEVNEKTSELQKVNRALQALSAGNEVIVKVRDEQQLLENICNIVVNISGYKMAWIGLSRDNEAKTVEVVAHSGLDKGYLDSLSVSWGDNQWGQGPTGKAIREHKICTANIEIDKDYKPWRKQAKHSGFAASLALPLLNGDQCYGALNIYAAEANAFDEAEKSFLFQLAKNVAHGMTTLRAEDEHEKTQDEMRKLSLAVEQADNIVSITNTLGIIEYVNPEFEKVTGYKKNEVLGLSISILKSGKQNEQFYKTLWKKIGSGESIYEVFTNRKKNGELYSEEKTISPIKNLQGEITHYISTGKDITDRIKDRQRIEYLAYHDTLTSLPNRELFQDRLDHAVALAHRKHNMVAVMFLDLDRFKQINDSLGHSIGDTLLKDAARRLQSSIREGDTVARIGGDEFTVICEDCNSRKDVDIVAETIINALSHPFFINDNEIYATASIGIAVYPEDALNTEELLGAADTAMYKAKVEGRNNFQFYSADLSKKVHEKVLLETELRRAIKNEEFVLYYQPRINIKTNEVETAEVLLRWNHPEKGIVEPISFIPILEETNLIVPVTEQVLRQSQMQLKAWKNTQFSNLQLAINMSVNLFRQGKILEIVRRVADECHASANKMEVEITENLLMEDVDSCIGILSQLKDSGFKVTIDDFGTGYSSMSYLQRLPIDCLKIDQAFVKNLETSNDDKAIVSAIVSLAHSLSLKVTAEGIETKEQLEFISKTGCDEGQGYYYTRPVSCEKFEQWLMHWSANNAATG